MPIERLHTEGELAKGLAQGDTGAFGSIMRNHYAVLLDYATRIVVDKALAEDIVEEVFIQVWKRHASFDSLNAVRKFLWINTRHDCMNALRNSNTRERHHQQIAQSSPLEEEATALHDMIRAEVLAEVYAAIRELPEKMQQIFILSYIDGMKNQEIAMQLNLSEQTVRNQKSRALEILRIKFRENDTLLGIIAWLIMSTK